MTPRSDDNAKGSSDEEDSDSSGSNSDVSSQDDSSDVSDLEKLKKRIPTSAPSLLEWTHELWNGIALVTQMRRSLVLTYLAGWRRYTPQPMFPNLGRWQG